MHTDWSGEQCIAAERYSEMWQLHTYIYIREKLLMVALWSITDSGSIDADGLFSADAVDHRHAVGHLHLHGREHARQRLYKRQLHGLYSSSRWIIRPAGVWSRNRSLSFEGDSDSGLYLFQLDFCV